MTATDDRWVLLRHRVRDDVLGVGLIWAGWAVFVFGMVLVIAIFRPIEVSGWETGSQIPRWFAGGMGVYLAAVYAPLYIAHGYTRREVARQMTAAGVVAVAWLAVLMTAGYVLERALYAIGGWPQELTQRHLFETATNYPMILIEFTLLFAVWAVAGAFVGATIYRQPASGLLTIPVGVLMVGLAEAVLNPGFFEVVTALLRLVDVSVDGLSLGTSVVVTAALVGVGLPATWMALRDMPLRSSNT